MITFLSKEKLSYSFSKLYTKIKNNFAAKSHTHTKSQISDFPSSLPANGGDADTVNGHTVQSNVPSNAKFTDTVYTLPTASASIKGGVMLGYSSSGKNYPLLVDSNGKAYVAVPWTDTNTTYGLASSTANGLMSKEDKADFDEMKNTISDLQTLVEQITNGSSGVMIEQ